FFFAFVAVLALIGAAAWLVRRFAGNRLGTNANRGRMPRLAVIDSAAVDGRRRLVLVRRDKIEHLLMIGGPTDIVVEPNIVRATPVRDQIAQRPSAGAEAPPRLPPLAESGWNEGDGARADSRSTGFDQAEPPPPPSPAMSSADQNLAGMAQRLEAALRRPAGDAAAEPRVGAPPVAPEPPPSRGAPPRNEPSTAPPETAPSQKGGFENLEDEM